MKEQRKVTPFWSISDYTNVLLTKMIKQPPLQKSKCSISHKIIKYVIFQRRQKALMWSKGLSRIEYSRLKDLDVVAFLVREIKNETIVDYGCCVVFFICIQVLIGHYVSKSL